MPQSHTYLVKLTPAPARAGWFELNSLPEHLDCQDVSDWERRGRRQWKRIGGKVSGIHDNPELLASEPSYADGNCESDFGVFCDDRGTLAAVMLCHSHDAQFIELIGAHDDSDFAPPRTIQALDDLPF